MLIQRAELYWVNTATFLYVGLDILLQCRYRCLRWPPAIGIAEIARLLDEFPHPLTVAACFKVITNCSHLTPLPL